MVVLSLLNNLLFFKNSILPSSDEWAFVILFNVFEDIKNDLEWNLAAMPMYLYAIVSLSYVAMHIKTFSFTGYDHSDTCVTEFSTNIPPLLYFD